MRRAPTKPPESAPCRGSRLSWAVYRDGTAGMAFHGAHVGLGVVRRWRLQSKMTLPAVPPRLRRHAVIVASDVHHALEHHRKIAAVQRHPRAYGNRPAIVR